MFKQERKQASNYTFRYQSRQRFLRPSSTVMENILCCHTVITGTGYLAGKVGIPNQFPEVEYTTKGILFPFHSSTNWGCLWRIHFLHSRLPRQRWSRVFEDTSSRQHAETSSSRIHTFNFSHVGLDPTEDFCWFPSPTAVLWLPSQLFLEVACPPEAVFQGHFGL